MTGLRLPLESFDLRIDAELSTGWTGLVGPSGAGKTSLLEAIAGFRRPAEGAIAIGGRIVSDAARSRFVAARERRIGYVTQDDSLFPHLSVRSNVAYGLGRRRPSSPGFDDVVSLLSIGPLLERRVGKLSGGERRRVALARAVLSGPDLLLLDEPLTGLDASLREQVLAALRTIHSRVPVSTIYVAHNPEEILALCDEVLVLERGRIDRRGSSREILSAGPQEPGGRSFRNGSAPGENRVIR